MPGTMRGRQTAAVVLVLFAIAAGRAAAEEGLRQIDGPTVITEPGSYVVTRSFSSGPPAIEVQADAVTIDLNGKSLTSLFESDVIWISGPPGGLVAGVTVRNGHLSGGRIGVFSNATGAGPVRLDRVHVEGATDGGLWIVDALNVEILDCSVRNVGGPGIVRDSIVETLPGRVRIERSEVTNTTFTGIFLQDLRGAVVVDNVVSLAANNGISVVSETARIERNAINGTVGAAPSGGIRLDDMGGSLVADNVVRDGTGHGIHYVGLGPVTPTLLRDNLIHGNAANGIEVNTDGIWAERNYVTDNGGYGLFRSNPVPGTLVYRNNVILGNSSGSIGETVPGLVEDRGGNVCDGVCP